MQSNLVIIIIEPAETESRTSGERAAIERINEHLDSRVVPEQGKGQGFDCLVIGHYQSNEVEWDLIQASKWFVNLIIDYEQIEGTNFTWSWEVKVFWNGLTIIRCWG